MKPRRGPNAWRLAGVVGSLWLLVACSPPEEVTQPATSRPPPANVLSAAERAAGWRLLFDGETLAGWRGLGREAMPEAHWVVEDGALKSHGLVEHWRSSLRTEKHYRDFVLMIEFRMPTISNSGISFRRLIPDVPELENMAVKLSLPAHLLK